MHESSLNFIFCIRCNGKLGLDIFSGSDEIKEGFLLCQKCDISYPIVSGVAILWNDFVSYLTSRKELGGQLYNEAKNSKLKSHIKEALSKVQKNVEDQTRIEKRWATIYQNNSKSKFYSKIKSILKEIKSDVSLEHGCSVGTISEQMTKTSKQVFGIDKSFFAIKLAKEKKLSNADFFVADSLFHPFANQKFRLILALNLLEIIEPLDLIKIISSQMQKGHLIISDPYDFERGKNSVNHTVSEKELRDELKKYSFTISRDTKKESFIPWSLQITKRTELKYLVDIVIAKKL